jgi:hypothetical protein
MSNRIITADDSAHADPVLDELEVDADAQKPYHQMTPTETTS